jgi:GTP:adenosylcobinamide-phosphate guanylyltransferase
MPEKVAALILAGGKNKPEMQAACGGVENRALVNLHGRPMLDYVMDAVRTGLAADAATSGGRILVAGDVPTPPGCVAVPGGESMIETLLSGASALEEAETRLLVVTADIPFLTAGAVADFLQRAAELGGDVQFVYPIVEAERCRRQYPDMRRTTLRIAEGEFTGGNIVLLDPAFLRRNQALLRDAYARRKSVAGLALLLGPTLPLRLIGSRVLPGLLAVRHLEAAVGRALGGATARAVVTPYAEIAADMDRPEDIPIAERILATAGDAPSAPVD